MRPFPARMVDEQGIEKFQEYETLGGESELTPLNAAASSLIPENQKPGDDSGLAGKISLGANLPACVSFVILGQQPFPCRATEKCVASRSFGMFGVSCCGISCCRGCFKPWHIQKGVQVAISVGEHMTQAGCNSAT